TPTCYNCGTTFYNLLVPSRETPVQGVRRHILEILKERGGATVAELAERLDMAPVSVRHHLDVLQAQDLICVERVRRRRSAGRPQQVYALTEAANRFFPQNFDTLSDELLSEVKQLLSEEEMQKLVQRLAEREVAGAPVPTEGMSLQERLAQTVRFLDEKGYIAQLEESADGVLLHTCHCPYAGVAAQHRELCEMDLLIISKLVNRAPVRVGRLVDGNQRCSYLFVNGTER
ncbi:MAG TPA: ArsR family transcriptional regulator, partial [Anaerolineae bacterium]|nr:ArsR family transcriptional regulator [Anaerolineae bacterium]